MKENETHAENTPKDFTFSLVLFDAVPVLLFAGNVALISFNFSQILFTFGGLICAASGCVKVIWKLLLVCTGKNIALLSKQLRYFMPTGFLLMCAGVFLGRSSINITALITALSAPPAGIFIGLGICGICAMIFCAMKLDGSKARNNWIEEGINAASQGCFFIGLLFASATF